MKTSRRLIVAIFLFIALLAWYLVASDYGDGATSGTYRLKEGGETSTLVLNSDHTFQQEVIRSGQALHATGTWRRIGEGGVAFSKDFLVLTGQEPGQDGTGYGELQKRFGVLTRISLQPYQILWYSKADASPDNSIVGTYKGHSDGVQATLVLTGDHTFEQTISGLTGSAHARGAWKNNSDNDIQFSREFLKLSGLAISESETATALGPQGLNLQIEIATNRKLSPPIYRKKQFPWQ